MASVLDGVGALRSSLERCQLTALARSLRELERPPASLPGQRRRQGQHGSRGSGDDKHAQVLGSRLVHVFLECVNMLGDGDGGSASQQPQRKRMRPSTATTATNRVARISGDSPAAIVQPYGDQNDNGNNAVALSTSGNASALSCVARAAQCLERLAAEGLHSADGHKNHFVQTLWANTTGLDPIQAARRVRDFETSNKRGTYEATIAILKWFDASLRLIANQRSVIDLRDKFQGFDEDNSGGITRDEFLAKLRAPPYSMRLSAPAVRELVARFDTDGDDQVDFSEFVAFFFDQKDSAESFSSKSGRDSSGSGGLSGQDLGQVNSVEQELREFFDMFTGRGKANVANENRIIHSVVNFAIEGFVGHAGWRYSVRRDRWEIAKLCLDTMCRVLSPESAATAASRANAPGRGSPSNDDENTRNVLLEALLEDRGLQHCLMTVVTMLASTAFKPTNHDDDGIGAEAYRRSGGLLPVDFSQGLHRSQFLTARELEDIECMVCRAFDLLVLVLEEPVGGVGSDSLSESPSDRIQHAQSKLNLVSFNLQIPKRALPAHTNTNTAIMATTEFKANAVVAIASFVQYAPFAKTQQGARIPELALRVLELICPVVAISAVSSRQKASQGGGMSQRLHANQFRGVHALSGMDTMPGGGLSSENQTSYTSLLGFFSKADHSNLRDMLKKEIKTVRGDDSATSGRRCAILRFVGAACEHQPSLGNLLLTDMVSNTGVFDYSGTSAKETAVLSSAFALLVEIWDQGRAKRDAFLAKIGDSEQQRAFWEKILRPLKAIAQSRRDEQQHNESTDVAGSRPRWQPAHSYNLEVCSFALQLLAYEMMVPHSMARGVLDAAVQQRGMIDGWFKEFCRFDYDAALVSRMSRRALENGVDLRLFVCLPVSPPGRRRYGPDYLYDAARMESVLAPRAVLGQNKVDPDRLLRDLRAVNLMSGTSDAQLFALRAWKTFVEMYCIAPPPVAHTRSSALSMSSPPPLRASNSITGADGPSAFVGDMTSRRILSRDNIKVVSALVRQHTESGGSGSVMVSAIQEMAELVVSMLHHRIFEPPALGQGDARVSGAEIGRFGNVHSRFSEAALAASGTSEAAAHTLRREDSGLNLAQHAVLIRGFRVWCASCFTGEGKDGLNIDLAQPLFAGALLVLLDVEAKGTASTRGGDDGSASQKLRKDMEHDIDELAVHAGRCVRILSNMLTGTGPREKRLRATRPDLTVSAHVIFDKSIALLSHVLSRKNGHEGPRRNRVSTMGTGLATDNTVEMVLRVLWPLLGRTSIGFDENFASGKSVVAILHFLNEFSQPQQVLQEKNVVVGNTNRHHLVQNPAARRPRQPRQRTTFQPCVNVLVQCDLITQLSGSLALRELQQEIFSPTNQNERGYNHFQERRQLHHVWCLVLSLVPVLIRHAGGGDARHPLAIRAFEQALDLLAVYEGCFLSVLERAHGWTRAALCEAEAVTHVVKSLISRNAQKWRLARPHQFQRFMRGMLLCCSSMSRLVRHNVRESLEGYAKLRTYTRAVALSEQHEQIVSMKQITIPTGWDADHLLDMYHFSYDKGRRVKDACRRLAMEISQDARVEHVGVFLLQRKNNAKSNSAAAVDKLELACMTTNEPFRFNMKIAVDSSTMAGLVVEENLKLSRNEGSANTASVGGASGHGVCACFPEMKHHALDANAMKTVSAVVAQSIDSAKLTTRAAFCAPIYERRGFLSNNYGPLLGVLLVVNHEKAKSGTTVPPLFQADQLDHVLDKARKLGTPSYLSIEVEDWVDVHLGSELEAPSINTNMNAGVPSETKRESSQPIEAKRNDNGAIGGGNGGSTDMYVRGEVIQVIMSPLDGASDVHFRVRFEASFYKNIQEDAGRVLNHVLPLLCDPSVSPHDPNVPRGLVEAGTSVGGQAQRGPMVAFTHLDGYGHARDARGNGYTSGIAGADALLTSKQLLVIAHYAFGILTSKGDDSDNFWAERRSVGYRRAVRLLEMSLFLFWNHAQRHATTLAMKGMDLEGNVLSKIKLMLQRIGIFGGANNGGGPGRSRSRGSSRSVSFGADGGAGGGGAAPASPRYRSRSPTIGSGGGSPRRLPSSRSPGSPGSPSWYQISYGDDSMTFELELERVFFLNDRAGLEEEVRKEEQSQVTGSGSSSGGLPPWQKIKVIEEGQGHFSFLKALADKLRVLIFA